MRLIAAAAAAEINGQTTHGIVNGAAGGWQLKKAANAANSFQPPAYSR
jgi:hypothetical protein